jgi:DNA-directed RNA polymerase beta subunit
LDAGPDAEKPPLGRHHGGTEKKRPSALLALVGAIPKSLTSFVVFRYLVVVKSVEAKMKTRIEVVANIDELGESEEFSWDVFPIVDPKATLHLEGDGLPKIGTRIAPGMIIVGKIGKTRTYDDSRRPTALDIHALSFDELRSRFGDMWNDTSLYASSETTGIVTHASIENIRGKQTAVVILEQD